MTDTNSNIETSEVDPFDVPAEALDTGVKSTLLARIADAEERLAEQGGITFTRYGFGAWSPSKIKMLSKCQYQFYLKYVLKVGPEDDFIPDTSMADTGSVAHRILEHVSCGRSVTDAYALAKAEHCEVPPELVKKGDANITLLHWEQKIVPLEANIITFQERLEAFGREHKIKKIHTELKLGVNKDWKKTTFFGRDVYFRGIIDLFIEIDNGPKNLTTAMILDHKHGGAEGDVQPSTRNYKDQLLSYKPLIHRGYVPVAGAVAGIHFIKAGKYAYGDYMDSQEIETKLIGSIEWNIGGAVDALKENGFFKHVRGNHCKYCEFDIPCKNKKLKENELNTKKWFQIKQVT